MVKLPADGTYRCLFLAQVVALVGTGLATVALGLLAFDLAGERAGSVLGTALAIKMLAYVGVAPVAAAVAERLPRRTMLVALDLVRGAVAACLPFVTDIWQIYVLIFVLQAACAAFTPAFQATIPDVLTDEREYTQALSLSRLAYDLESLVSPLLAAALLSVIGYNDLFAGTALGFLVSAALVMSTRLPQRAATAGARFGERVSRGIRIYLATPRLRGLMAVNVVVASAGALVIVNTVVLVQGVHGLGQRDTALALAAFGAGSMTVALLLPSLLDREADRSAMLAGSVVLAVGAGLAAIVPSFGWLLPLWFALGTGYSLAQTPSGRLLRRSSGTSDRLALFAAQFALSHAGWLVTYPLAGWAGATYGVPASAVALASLGGVAVIVAVRVWPSGDPTVVEHRHDHLPADHPHWREGERHGRGRHAHAYHIDALHRAWPHARRADGT